MEAQLYQTVPLTYSRIQDGSEVVGLSVTVKVVDARTGTVLLNTAVMNEVVPGHYVFEWLNSIINITHCKAIYSESGQSYVEYFDVIDEDDIIERSAGKTA